MSVFNQSRSYIIRLIFIGLFLVMLVQLFNLQVVSDKYHDLAQSNAIFKKIVYPPRGFVYDRNGKPIVNNKLVYDLMVRPSELKNVDTTYLCQLLEIDTVEFRKRIVTAFIKGGNRPSAFEPLLTPEKYARLQENIWRIGNGFFLQERPIREYPFNAGGHFVGYIGEVDSGIIARSEGFYQQGDYVGRSGLEAYYEKVLMGQRGVQYWIKDNHNRLVGRFDDGKQDAKEVAGRALKTYVDIELQQLAEKLMQNKVGAVVALEPKTGGIIAMVSGPNFTPDALTGYNFKKNYSKFVLDVSKPLLNRAIKGQYPPGSTYKPIGGLVALDEGIISPRFGYPCGGRYYACGHGKPACTHAGGGHADNLRLAIANSCNAYFAHVYRLTVDNPKIGNVKDGYQKWKEYMNNFGLGVRLGVDLPSEDKGSIPDSSVYNKVYRNSWNSCTNLTLGIGQDMMTSTPLQLANAMCLIANKGYYYTPHFVKEIEGETKEDTILTKFRQRHDPLTQVSDTAFEAIIAGMQDVVEIGTARSAKIPGINVCAKTGTAENYKILDGKRVKLKDNSVFVCFAPRENPKIAIAVVVENAGYGGTWAGPISALLMEKYLNDTLRPERVKEVERIAAANLMPGWLAREQFREDSVRARYWFNLTKDSNYLRKYIHRAPAAQPKRDTSNKEKPPVRVAFNKIEMIAPEKNYFITRKRGNV
jgi:penicillin-binding protein 2